MPKAAEIQRTLRRDGSFFLVIKEPVVNGERHTFLHDLVAKMKDAGWRFCDELIWMMPNPLPRRAVGRLKDAFQRILHFTLTKNHVFYPDAVRQPAKPTNGQSKRFRTSVGGFKIDASNFEYGDTALPGNVLTCAHVSQSLLHDSAHPDELASFFIRLATKEGDVVLDPFLPELARACFQRCTDERDASTRPATSETLMPRRSSRTALKRRSSSSSELPLALVFPVFGG